MHVQRNFARQVFHVLSSEAAAAGHCCRQNTGLEGPQISHLDSNAFFQAIYHSEACTAAAWIFPTVAFYINRMSLKEEYLFEMTWYLRHRSFFTGLGC